MFPWGFLAIQAAILLLMVAGFVVTHIGPKRLQDAVANMYYSHITHQAATSEAKTPLPIPRPVDRFTSAQG